MSLYCEKCGKPINYITNERCICNDCSREEYQTELEEKVKNIKEPGDFKSWSLIDVSELFWMHIGIYQQTPNETSLNILKRAYLWAIHEDKALANSMSHTLKWTNINIHKKS